MEVKLTLEELRQLLLEAYMAGYEGYNDPYSYSESFVSNQVLHIYEQQKKKEA